MIGNHVTYCDTVLIFNIDAPTSTSTTSETTSTTATTSPTTVSTTTTVKPSKVPGSPPYKATISTITTPGVKTTTTAAVKTTTTQGVKTTTKSRFQLASTGGAPTPTPASTADRHGPKFCIYVLLFSIVLHRVVITLVFY